MLTVLFYRFQKRRESTAVPSGAALFTLGDVIINDGASSLLQPQLTVAERRIDSAPYTGIYMTNYCYIAAFERYYYIADWTYNGNGTWTASCSVDVLASFRGEIAASGGYLDRSTAIRNQNLMDAFYPAANIQFVRKSQLTTGMTGVPSGATYIIGILSGTTSSEGGPSFGTTTYYYINQSNLKQLMMDMMNTGSEDWSAVDDLGGDVLKSIVNPLQFITSCKMFPFAPPAGISYPDSIKFGYWVSHAYGKRCTDIQEHTQRTWTLEVHEPQHIPGDINTYPRVYTNGGNTYELPNYPPYAAYTLIHPAFGTFEIDPSMLATYPSIALDTYTNYITGMSTLIVSVYSGSQVSPDSHYELFRQSTMLAIDVPLAQITTDYVNLAKSAVGAIGNAAGIAMGGGVNAAAGLLNNLIDAAVTAIRPNVQSSGPPAGSFMLNITDAWLEESRFATIPQDPDSFGYASKQHVIALPSSGFVKMAHTDFRGSCTAQEREMICEFLESGVYMESIGSGGGGSENG